MIFRKTKYRIWSAFLCFVCLGFLYSHPAQGDTSSGEAPAGQHVLRVGVSADAPPLVYKEGKNIVGLEPELAKALGQFMGKSVEFVELKWVDQIPALLDNRTDIIMSGMSMTNEREYRIAFCEPYLKTGQIGLIRRSDDAKVPKAGYKGIVAWAPAIIIGVVEGTTGEFVAKKYFSNAKKIKAYAAAKEAVEDLEDGDIDIVIYDAPMIHYLAAGKEGKLIPLPSLLTEEYLAWGVRKSDGDLLEAAKKFMETMKKEGKLDPIIKRWIPFQ